MAKKYIDAEKLRAEIKEIENEFKTGNYYLDNSEQAVGYYNALMDFERLIDSLQQEQPEEDLEKEYQEFCKDYPFPWSSQYVNREYIDELCLSIARHFFVLGLKAKEKTNERNTE